MWNIIQPLKKEWNPVGHEIMGGIGDHGLREQRQTQKNKHCTISFVESQNVALLEAE